MTLAEARRRWSKRRRRYVVGYINSGNVLYSHPKWDKKKTCQLPMTRKEAEFTLESMPSPGAAIFEVCPLKIGGGSR